MKKFRIKAQRGGYIDERGFIRNDYIDNKITAIKAVRQANVVRGEDGTLRANTGLKEAKELVEAAMLGKFQEFDVVDESQISILRSVGFIVEQASNQAVESLKNVAKMLIDDEQFVAAARVIDIITDLDY